MTRRWQNEAEYRSFCDILHLEATGVRRYVVLDVAMDGYESLFLRYSLDGIQQIREELLAQCEQALGGVTGVFVEDILIGCCWPGRAFCSRRSWWGRWIGCDPGRRRHTA